MIETKQNSGGVFKVLTPPLCSHCGEPMKKMSLPDEAGFDCDFLYVCFNDECSYFVKGWEWMKSHYEVRSSYRNRIDPLTGKENPLPVWSRDALKNRIIP